MALPPIRVRGLLHPACGPLVRVELRGEGELAATGLAVLDTGASMSAIDRVVARRLALPSPGAASWYAVSDAEGHTPLSPLRRAAVRVAADPRLWRLDLIEVPGLAEAVSGYEVLALLGWDFLRLCRLSCDGPAGTFELELPPRDRAKRS